MSNRALLHFNGSDASTTIVDEVGTYAWSCVADAQLDTAQQKFGSASLLCDGSGDYVQSTNIGALPASGGWTIDLFVRFNSLAANQCLFDYFVNGLFGGLRLIWRASTTKLSLFASSVASGGSSFDIVNGGDGTKSSWSTGQWYHIAIVRDDTAGAYYLYVDGVLDKTVTTAAQITSALDRARIGAQGIGTADLNGWIDEFHIDGTCLFPGGTTFSPPTAEYEIPTVSGADTVTVTESVSVLLPKIPASAFDSVTVSESVALILVDLSHLPIVVSDSVTVAEAVTVSLRVFIAASDAVTLTEATTLSFHQTILPTSVFDAVTVSEHVSVTFRSHGRARHRAPVGYAGYLSRHRAPVGYRALARHRAVYSLMGSSWARHRAPYDLMARGLARHRAVYDLSATNHGLARHRACWSLLSTPVDVVTSRPFLEHAGARLELLDASISQSEGGQFWNLRASLARASDYLRLSRLDAIALEIFGDRYELVVETLGRSNASRGVVQRFDVSCRSPLWATLGEPGERVTRTWSAVNARAAVEELAGESVDWRITDWQIPAGRLAAVNETAITVIQRIVQAAGGVVESAKDGGLVCRYRYPVSIPQAAGATPDHALTESVNVYELSERLDERQAFDRITLTDESVERGYLSAERDAEQPETILAGESQKFLVFHSPDVEIRQILQSDGTLIDFGPAAVAVEDEEIVFANTDTAEVQKIASSGFTYTWFGAGLGSITVGSDRRKLIAGTSGVGVARVSYIAEGHRYAVLAPASSGGRTEFPIIVYVIGALREDEQSSVSPLRIVVQRGAGTIPGDDIVDPLMANENVMLNRGRNEIDGAAAKGQVTLTNSYPVHITDAAHVVNGELLLVEDSQLGFAWRGKARDVEHRISVDPRAGSITVNSNIAAERFL